MASSRALVGEPDPKLTRAAGLTGGFLLVAMSQPFCSCKEADHLAGLWGENRTFRSSLLLGNSWGRKT